MLTEEGHAAPTGDKVDITLAASEQERELIKALAAFPEEMRMAARDYDPSYINRYLVSLAGTFHRFYNACRIKGEAADVIAVRLKLAQTTRQVLRNGLGILGVTAPEKM